MTENLLARREEWSPCKREIERFVNRVKRRRGLGLFGRMAAGAASGALLVILFTGPPDWGTPQNPILDFRIGGVTCAEVRAMADDLMAGRLDEATAGRIRAHLEACPHCGVLFDRMLKKPVPANDEADRGPSGGHGSWVQTHSARRLIAHYPSSRSRPPDVPCEGTSLRRRARDRSGTVTSRVVPARRI